jgi:RNA polymerase sigma-70 factor (ECF subfamily)
LRAWMLGSSVLARVGRRVSQRWKPHEAGNLMPIFREQPELLAPFHRGERRALERVYRFYVRGLDAYLRALARAAACPELVQPSAVADLLQDTFVRAFAPAARESIDVERPFGPYVRAIARNLFIDQLRARGREAQDLAQSLPELLTTPPESHGTADPRVSAVLQAYIGSLPDPLKGVYEQRFVFAHSQEDACAALGVSRRQLRTAEEHLKAGLRRALVHAGIMRTDLDSRPSVAKPVLREPSLGKPHAAR